MLHLDDPITAVAGLGASRARALDDAYGLQTVRDLIEHYPRRYADLGAVLDLDQVAVGQPATLIGEVVAWDSKRVPPRGKRPALTITTASVRQGDGGVFEITYFNQAWRSRQLRPGTVAAFRGKVDRFQKRLQIKTPEVEILDGLDEDGVELRRMLSIYPATDAVPSHQIARFVEAALDELPPIPDHLPERLLDEEDLLTLDDAVRFIHQPPDDVTRRAARKRLVFDELLTLQVGLQWRRARLEAETVGLVNEPVADGRAAQLLESLPFAPTGAQRKAFDEIGADLAQAVPMHRLLQGDVGAGKTLVATWSMLCAVDNRRQAALMVPTEVLAEQHYRTLTEQLAPLGVNVLDGVRVELLTGSTTASQKRRILGELLSGQVDVVVGTHALLEEGVRFADLGLVVVDEQHRFGVAQRVTLKEKAGGPHEDVVPDVLVMTATPIPRSLALTLYGDLDVTTLDELPPGRTPVTTQLITPRQSDRRSRLYDFVRQQAADGLQTYVVCPLVEDSEEIGAASATSMRDRLATEVWPDLEIGLVHGRMRPDEKDASMQAFRRGDTPVLVSTTVIEVGVDVPQATVMIIEDAERFGISQLHQLRGRVGRSSHASYCVLFAGWNAELGDDALDRLEAVAGTTDGFELAEKDLEIRGEGQLFGIKQSGLPDLKLAKLQFDRPTVEHTRTVAREIVRDDPHLTDPAVADLRREVVRRYRGGLEELEALATG